MRALIAKFLVVYKKTLMTYCLIGLALAWMLVAFFPAIADQADQFSVMLESYPESFLKAFGVEGDLFGNFESFFAAENYSLMWPLLMLVMVIGLAGNAIAGEVENGTVYLLLSQPMTRARLYWGKYCVGTILLVVFTLITVLGVIPLANLYGVEVDVRKHLLIAAVGFLFGQAVFSVGMMVSALFSNRARVVSITGGLLALMYSLNLAASLQESADKLKYASFFYYYDFTGVLAKGEVMTATLVVFSSVIVICSLVGVILFQKRDLSV